MGPPNPFSPAAIPSNMGTALEAMLYRMASMVEESTNAASVAAAAVQSMHHAQSMASTRSGLEGRDLLKILPKPEPFKVDKAEDEHSRWHSWYWVFRQYLVAVDANFDVEISAVERSLNTPVLIVSAEQQARSFQLYALLSTLIKGRAFQTVKQINQQQGYEALRMLLLQFQPPSKVRSLGILSALTQIKGFNPKEPYLPQVLELERAFEQYSLASGEDVQPSLKSALLLRSLTGQMRQHICASLPEDASYSVLREAVLRFERVQFKWGANNVFAQDSMLLGTKQHSNDDAMPMEIDRIKGKPKGGKPKGGKEGKGARGKDKGKGKGGGKGKGWYSQDWKGKGKGYKGKDDKGGKGKAKGAPKGRLDPDVCGNCGRRGHWKNECWLPPMQGRVQQVADDGQITGVPSSAASSVSQATASTRAPTVGSRQVNRVEAFSAVVESDEEVDLTVYSMPSGSHVRVVQYRSAVHVQSSAVQVQSCAVQVPGAVQVQSGAVQVQSGAVPIRSSQVLLESSRAQWYDMSSTDSDGEWSMCSEPCACDLSCDAIAGSLQGAIRVAGFRSLEDQQTCVADEVLEVVLDSGADESCLPYAYAEVGCKASSDRHANFSDAQGNPLKAYGWRYAQVMLDNGVTFRERFLVTDVTSPLLACGKLYKAGWSVQHENNELVLSKGSRKVPVRFRHNSLVVEGSIRTVSSKPQDSSVRAVCLNPVLQGMVEQGSEFFEELIPGVHGLKCETNAYLDITLYLPMEGMQYRTTLVCVDSVLRIWELWELCKDITTLDVLDEQFPDGVERTVLTIASREVLTAEQLGIVAQDASGDVVMDGPAPASPVLELPASAALSSRPEDRPFESTVPGTPELEALFASDDDEREKQHHDGAGVPVSEQAAVEAAARDDEMSGDFVEVNGVRITADSALSVMRKGCEYLNIGRSGGKAKVFKRLCEHLKCLELAEGVRLKQERAQAEHREPQEVPVVREPTQHERLKHCLTHAPYQPWCEFCVMHKARSDRASAVLEPKRAVSVLSFDFGFTGRDDDPESKLITLCVKDRDTGWREAIPTKRKGGPESIRFLTGEVVRLCNVLGYNDITLRCDPEPSCRSLQQEIQKARGRLGQRTRLELAGEEEKASNGAAEETVESTRQQACVLLSAYEHHTGKKVSSLHPLHAWAARHGSWLLNRYCVARDQQTPFECTFQSPYTGKLVEFGECVMAMCRTAMANKPVKGSAKWVRSMWLGKANANDGHLVVTAGGKLLITRSIRRTPERWDPSLHDRINDFPWDHPGFVAGGLGRMRKQREPKPVEAVAEADPVPEANDDGVLGPVSPLLAGPGDEAGSDPETSLNYSPSAASDKQSSSGNGDDDDDDASASQQQPSEVHPVAMQGVEGEAAQVEPGASSAGGDGEPTSAEERPAKSARLFAVTQSELYHNDAPLDVSLEDDEVDHLESYDYQLDDYYFSEDADVSSAPPDELWRPFGPTEPQLSESEMLIIDSSADRFEIRRLLSMGVLEDLTEQSAERAQLEGSRLLSTKFVRSWRIKMRSLPNDKEEQQYLRRSRFVGREFAFLDKSRTELFAPASSSLLTRLLPSVFMRCKAEDHACCVLDVTDAFLTVDQRIPTIVQAQLGDQQTHVQHFRLLKLLPGQRDGTVRWHEAFTAFLDDKLGLEPYVPCPALFRLKNVAVAGLLHVDDLFSEGKKHGLEEMVSCVKGKYKCTVSWLCSHGDEVSFLKKSYRLVREDLLVIQPHPRHVEKLAEMFNLTRSKPKLSPLPTALPTDDDELDGERSGLYRTAVGILLYLQADVVEAQFGIRWLAQYMSRPTVGALRVLKHMILYLRGVSGYAVGFPVPTKGVGISVQSQSGLDVLETHTDADWAGDRVHRKSVSGCIITLNSHVLSTSSRTQKSIALSSGESEYASAVSGTCDQVFIRNAAEFVLREKVESHLLLDSAAARGVIARQGAGKIRHLEAKMLWLQQYAREHLHVHPVDGKQNIADLGTKSLNGPRIKALLHKLGVRDAHDDYSLVGTEEFQNLLDGNTVRKLVRLVKQQGNVGNSVGLQVAMIVLSHALSQHAVAAAADTGEPNEEISDDVDGVQSAFQQALEMIMLVATFAAEYAQQYPVAAATLAQGFMWLLVVCLGWCMCRRRNVHVIMRADEPGDGDGEPATSSNDVPGRLNFNVPLLTPGASVKLEASSGGCSSASAGSASESEIPRARREPVRPKPKAGNRGDDEVRVFGSQGYSYHKAGCGKLNSCTSVSSTTR